MIIHHDKREENDSSMRISWRKISASCEVWTHDPWFTRPVLCHWAKEASAKSGTYGLH